VAALCVKINHNHRATWHYVFSFGDSRMADFCGFPSLDIAPTVEDGCEKLLADPGEPNLPK
jgi:hypothetical protein